MTIKSPSFKTVDCSRAHSRDDCVEKEDSEEQSRASHHTYPRKMLDRHRAEDANGSGFCFVSLCSVDRCRDEAITNFILF